MKNTKIREKNRVNENLTTVKLFNKKHVFFITLQRFFNLVKSKKPFRFIKNRNGFKL